jgi:hypothetical protein
MKLIVMLIISWQLQGLGETVSKGAKNPGFDMERFNARKQKYSYVKLINSD